MFVGRQKELAILEDEWNRAGFCMPVIYGRRHVGKTAILKKFSDSRDVMFFTPGLDPGENVTTLKRIMAEKGIASEAYDIGTLIGEIMDATRERHIGLIIDEFPYLVSGDAHIPAQMQRIIDKKKGQANIFFLLCGSFISFMKDHVLGCESPFFGRWTSQCGIRPFTVFDAARFFPDSSFQKVCEIYGMVDGTPHYLDMMTEPNFIDNLRKNFLSPSAYLFEETRRQMRQEFRKPELYHSLLEIISSGPKKRSEIMDKMSSLGIGRKQTIRMIDYLVKIEVIKPESPLGGQIEKNMPYRIDDLFFHFWHKFILKVSLLVRNWNINPAVKYVTDCFSEYMGYVFGKICGQWLMEKSDLNELPFSVSQMGSWWRNGNKNRTREKIDIVASDSEENRIFCECKWRNEPVGTDVLNELVRKSMLVPAKSRYYILFSKNGFTNDCRTAAKKLDQCRLMTVEKMGKI